MHDNKKDHIHEHEIITGPGGIIKETDREIERTVAGPSTFTSDLTAADGTILAVDETVVENVPAATAAPSTTTTTRINPRTGKSLSIPKPLSLTPQNMSPINTPADGSGPQLIREEHEEVSPIPMHYSNGVQLTDLSDCSASWRRPTRRHQKRYSNLYSSRRKWKQGHVCRSICRTTVHRWRSYRSRFRQCR